jgi:hypothetical protein
MKNVRRWSIPFGFAFVGWAFCAAIMGVLPPLIGMKATLVVHLIAGPTAFAALGFSYRRWFGDAAPVAVAAMFVGFVIAMDFGLVAVVILKSMDMFRSILGTWLPFLLIFLASWAAGSEQRTVNNEQ